MKKDKLLACPFCGENAIITKSRILVFGYRIKCSNEFGCGVSLEGEVYDDAGRANYLRLKQIIERWNKRVVINKISKNLKTDPLKLKKNDILIGERKQ